MLRLLKTYFVTMLGRYPLCLGKGSGRGMVLLAGLMWLCWIQAGSVQVGAQLIGEDKGTIEFQVRIKPGREQPGNVFVAGSHPQLGNWRPDGLPLTKQSDSLWVGQIEVDRKRATGQSIEFKLTRGSWGTVEKDAQGREIANRSFQIDFVGDPPLQRISVLVEGWSTGEGPHNTGQSRMESTVTGTLKLHPPIESQLLSQPGRIAPRRIAVWLPPDYEHAQQRYPVLYLHDGQNLFDRATAPFGVEWEVDETATKLIQQGKIEPLIIVGIWNTLDRIAEYTPCFDPLYQQGGSADEYLKVLVEEIKPIVDQTYRTRPDRQSTAIAGSSLGGLVSIYACQKHSQTFSQCAAMSPSLGWNQEALLKQIENQPTSISQTRFWIDMGTSEGSSAESQQANVARVQRLVRAMESGGLVPGKDFKCLIVPDGRHHESAWGERFGEVLLFLYGKDSAN